MPAVPVKYMSFTRFYDLPAQLRAAIKLSRQGRLLHINDGANAPWKK